MAVVLEKFEVLKRAGVDTAGVAVCYLLCFKWQIVVKGSN